MSATLLRLMATSWIAVLALVTPARCDPADEYTISQPFPYENLTVYFVHAKAPAGPVPLTLQEALENQKVRVVETGTVNELAVENLSDEKVFIQSGDIVTGGRQDRALTVSLVLPPHSGRIPIAAFCVEQGRWTPRGAEDGKTFTAASAAVPSRQAKVVMSAPSGPAKEYVAQQAMWDEARRIQQRLSDNLKAEVAEPLSPTSLGLTLANETLQRATTAYVTSLQPTGERDDDVVGFVFAINGRVNSAAVYASNGLFRKMWPKLLRASAVEAIGAGTQNAQSPTSADIRTFLKSAESGPATDRQLTASVTQQTRDSEHALFLETRQSDGPWVARNYLAK
jgi:outer membrane lipopolysaccharide assembly protein LptE/RlpB